MPEEGLEPPTRGLLIPLRLGSIAPFGGAGGHRRGHFCTRLYGDLAALSRSGEAVAYITCDVKRSVSRRLNCRGPSLEALRTAHMASPLRAAAARPTYA